MNRAIRKESGLPQQTAQQVLGLVANLARPGSPSPHGRDRAGAMAVLDLALQIPRLAHHVINALIEQHFGSETLGPALREHMADPMWGKPYPLAVQEYGPLIRRGPLLHLGLMGLLQQNAWPRNALLVLSEAVANEEDVCETAAILARDFVQIADDLHMLHERLQQVKEIKASSNMHVAQVETFLAAKLSMPTLRGTRTLDVGCGGGELIAAFAAAGAVASGTEVSDEYLLGVPEEPNYDVVTATALFEPGAFAWPETGVNTWAFEQHADVIIDSAAKLLKPNGILVARNISCGMPFTTRTAHAAGLRYERVLIPLATPSLGGRLAVWRKF